MAYGDFDPRDCARPAIGFQDETEAFIEVCNWDGESFLFRHMQVEIRALLAFKHKARTQRFAIAQDLAEAGRAIGMFFDGDLDGLVFFMQAHEHEI